MNYMLIPGMIRQDNVRKEYGYKRSNNIISVVLSHFDITHEQLVVKSRKRDVVYKRHVLMYLLSKNTGLTYVKIGSIFSMNHTTIIHSVRQLKNLMFSDSDIREEVEYLQERI